MSLNEAALAVLLTAEGEVAGDVGVLRMVSHREEGDREEQRHQQHSPFALGQEQGVNPRRKHQMLTNVIQLCLGQSRG